VHAPVLLHLPVALHAFRPSSQTPFTFLGVDPQVPLLQVPVVQSVLGQTFGVPTQAPPVQRSSVQGLLSVQAAVLLSVYWQPAVVLQLSLVHGLLSLHTTAVLTHAPVPAAQVSVVQALLSEQFLPGFAVSTVQAPSKQTLLVQASPSSHTVLSANLP
jgi:hypothetical protein